MNSREIEALLKRAPAPVPPPQLNQRLLSSIALPDSPGGQPLLTHDPAVRLRARWLGLAAGFVAVLLVGWGSVYTSNLAKRNQELTESLRELQDTATQSADTGRVSQLEQEIDRLRQQNRELHQLRAEVAALRPMIKELEALRQEHQELLESYAQQQTAAAIPSIEENEPMDERTQSIACINNLKQIGLAARVWAIDNQDILPPDLISMSNELSSPVVLHCPADQSRPRIPDWTQFHESYSSYEFLNPGGSDVEPMILLARCRIHGHFALSDGSVLDGPGFSASGRRLFNRNGRLEVEPARSEPPEAPSPEYYERLMMERYGIIPTAPSNPPLDAEQPER
jgi:hypothetical protein